MSGRKLALLLCALALLMAGWRYREGSRRVEANSYAAYAERSLAAAFRKFGGALPRRFLEDNLLSLEYGRKIDPASVEAAVSQAGYLFLLRRFEAAEKVYLEALALEERSEIYANLARLYLQQDRPAEAIAPLQKAMQIDPQMKPTLEPMLEAARRAVAAQEAAEKARQERAAGGASAPETPQPNELAGLVFADDFESGRLDKWWVVGAAVGS